MRRLHLVSPELRRGVMQLKAGVSQARREPSDCSCRFCCYITNTELYVHSDLSTLSLLNVFLVSCHLNEVHVMWKIWPQRGFPLKSRVHQLCRGEEQFKARWDQSCYNHTGIKCLYIKELLSFPWGKLMIDWSDLSTEMLTHHLLTMYSIPLPTPYYSPLSIPSVGLDSCYIAMPDGQPSKEWSNTCQWVVTVPATGQRPAGREKCYAKYLL